MKELRLPDVGFDGGTTVVAYVVAIQCHRKTAALHFQGKSHFEALLARIHKQIVAMRAQRRFTWPASADAADHGNLRRLQREELLRNRTCRGMSTWVEPECDIPWMLDGVDLRY